MLRIVIMFAQELRQRILLSMGIFSFWCLPVIAGETVDDLPDLTGGVVPHVSFKEHDPFTSSQLTSVSHIEYVIRVKNQTGDPVVGDSLVLVVDKIVEISGTDISDRVVVEGADGHLADGRPYFQIPVGDEPDLAPYAESEPVVLKLDNPDYLRFYPPTLQVRGERRASSKSVKGLLDTLVNKGVLTTDEATRALEPSSTPAKP